MFRVSVKLKGYVSPREIMDFLHELGLDASQKIRTKTYPLSFKDVVFMNEEDLCTNTQGYIYVKYKGETQAISYEHEDVVKLNQTFIKNCIKNGTAELIGETTFLSLVFKNNDDDDSIITKIAKHFDGFVRNDKNDGWWFQPTLLKD